MQPVDLHLADGIAVLPGAGPVAADILVRDGRIAAVVEPGTEVAATTRVDCRGRHILPGVVDAHVHLGADITVPKRPEDVAAETQAAAAGGVTTLLAYLMTAEPYDAVLPGAQELMAAHAAIDFGFHFCIVTQDQLDALPSYVSDLGVSSFKFFMNFRGDEGAYLGLPGNDDGFLLDLLEAARDAGALVCPHAENVELVWRLRRIGIEPGRTDLETYCRSRPDYVEAEALGRVAFLAEVAGADVYAVHVTNRAALRVLEQARERHDRIFVETCPHYLTLDVDAPCGVYGKVNPPLRTADDRAALWDAVADGFVDAIGSDHVPRHRSFKERDLASASAGFPGMQTLLPLLLSEGHLKRGIPLERIVDLVSTRPAQLFGLAPAKGAIRPGADADLVVVDLDAPAVITAETQLSGAEYTPWEGWETRCSVVHTLVRGEFAFRDGAPVPGARGRYVRRPASGTVALEALA
jgi:dihydropyrimidinase